MCSEQMHADELDIDAALVGRLIAEQFPQWAELPVVKVPSAGTDHAMYRLADDMVVRLPRMSGGAAGRQGAAVAAAVGAAPPAARAGAARPRRTRRGVPDAVVRLCLAGRRERDRPARRRPATTPPSS